MLLYFIAERLAEASQESGSKYASEKYFFYVFVLMWPSDDSHKLPFFIYFFASYSSPQSKWTKLQSSVRLRRLRRPAA